MSLAVILRRQGRGLDRRLMVKPTHAATITLYRSLGFPPIASAWKNTYLGASALRLAWGYDSQPIPVGIAATRAGSRSSASRTPRTAYVGHS